MDGSAAQPDARSEESDIIMKKRISKTPPEQ